jgi:hypothetical protein
MSGIADSSAIVALACLCGLALLGLLVALRISSRLARIERLLRHQTPDVEAAAARHDESRRLSPEFEQFLTEEPARRELPKSEQFAAYRRWRKERGLSWGS